MSSKEIIRKDKIKNNIKEEDKNSNIKNKENEIKSEDIYPKDKINKPIELKNFDAISHFKENIIHFTKNCIEPIKDSSYYCFTCKHSVCDECGVYEHKEHLLIQRDNCLNYDSSFFNEIAKIIEKGINMDNKKSQIKIDISKSIEKLKEELDILEKEKLKEIDNIFKEIKANYITLKENYLKTKDCIENYYKINKKFFNIGNIKQSKVNKIKINENVDKGNNANSKSSMMNYFNSNDNDIGPNKDLENTVFLMNFELMNLCDNKNLDILDISNNINSKISDMSNLIEETTKEFIEYIRKKYLNFGNEIISKFDDFYWDIKVRCEKYTEHINTFKGTVRDIYKRNGSLDKLKDLLGLFDSKNNKGKDILFNQQFFIRMNDISSLNTDLVKSMTKKLYLSNGKVRSTSKNKLNSKLRIATGQDNQGENKKLIKNNKTKTNSDEIANNNEKIVNNNENEGKNETRKTQIKTNIIIPKKENIILNQRLIQRFYAYSILDFYTKYFKVSLEDKKGEEISFDIQNNIKEITNNNIKSRLFNDKNRSKSIFNKHDKKNNSKNNIKINNSVSNINNNNFNNINEGKINNFKNKNNIRSVSLLSNYSERYTELKEKVKPIINTNYIQLFNPSTTKITKIKVPLVKEEHGYTAFPDGCRHLLIDSDLYITGGTDNCGYPINVVLIYNLSIGEVTRLSNLNDNHSYHSIEYLENFDSIIIIGGENCSSCEIMDLDSKKWTKLPSLNFPRANSNIYYNNITSDLFVLFGMEGEMNNKPNNTDIIEVLELNDIISGWMMVDYYKSVGLDLKNNYCITLPFTRDKLLIFGGSSSRSLEKKLFALFDMIKNECIKVDSQTMDLIKLEENKIRAFDNAIKLT
jgi:hypothetical protein